jgi:hypothetical protein
VNNLKLNLRAILPVLGFLILLVPAQGPAAPGVGRVVVTPTHVVAGSTNTFKLTFAADTAGLQGQTLLDVPRGWSPPQATKPDVKGYVALANNTCSASTSIVRVAGNRVTIAANCQRGQGFDVNYGPATASTLSADGYVFLTQTRPNAGVTATKLVKVMRVVKDKKTGKRVKKTITKRVQYVIKPTFRPLAQKKQPIVYVTGGPVDHLAVNAPTIASSGTPFTLNVRAEDVYGNPAAGYTGTISLSSTDPDAFLPSSYTFASTDLSAKNFGGVILRAVGTQTITATDNAGHADASNAITVYSFG